MRALATALFVAAFLVAGLVVFALVWSGTGPYLDLMTASQPAQGCVMLFGADGRERCHAIPELVEYHRAWSSYVTGATSDPPRFDDVRFTADEYAHMADVRDVFALAKFAAAAGAIVMLIRVTRARSSGVGALQLIRDGALIAAAFVVALGGIAAFAFEPAFLAFHALFFPQGNFLFDPATSDLVRIYPDPYWEGISLRVGLSFIVFALAVAGFAQWRIRSAK